MCGICGIVHLAGGPAPDPQLLLRMLGRLAHRGPDGSGYYRDRSAALGHTRLSIIDLTGGAQPLSNEDGSIWITFNGEIFNYVELTEELTRLGHRFQTRSDTEVVVHAFEQWDTGCFERFNGQWAMALWDSRRKRLMLSRDRLGIRPLYYTITGGRLLFASEIKALLADPSVPRRLDPAGLAQVFTFWCPVAPRTAFEGIHQLPPGHCAVLEGGRLTTRPYWRLSFPAAGAEPSQDEAQNAKDLRQHLVEAARLRFVRSDVPVGAYLSGGLDSSVTAAIVTHYTDAPLRTFSIRFQDSEFDEGQYQQQMVQMLGAEHRDVAVSYGDIAGVFPEVVWHAECPILRTAPAPLYLLSKLVRENGYKVVVTGEGADEVLAGYDLYREARARLFLSRDPASAKRAEVLMRLYPWMARSPGKAPAFAQAFFGKDLDPSDPALSHRPRWNTTAAVAAMLHPDLRQAVQGAAVADELVASMPAEAAGWDPLTRAQWLEMTTLLSGYILSSQGDRMLMAHSVEGRFPYLDCNLVGYANQLPPRHKLLGLDEKHVLKTACADLVPTAIAQRPKQPYRAPDASSFFSGQPPEWLEALTADDHVKDSAVLETETVRSLVGKCRRVGGLKMSNTDNMRLVAVLSTLLLHQQYVREDGRGISDEKPAEPVRVTDRVL